MSDLKIDNSNNTIPSVSVTQILLQKLKHALTHKSSSTDNNNFTSFSINFYEWSKIINTTRD